MLSPFTTNRVSSNASAATFWIQATWCECGFYWAQGAHKSPRLASTDVPEHELPTKFAAKLSKVAVHVLVKGKQWSNEFSNGFANEWDESML
jgi:hypothetical protein